MKKRPDEPYIYQPFGALTSPKRKEESRLYGIGGMGSHTDIKGLSKEEAERLLPICKLIKKERQMSEARNNHD